MLDPCGKGTDESLWQVYVMMKRSIISSYFFRRTHRYTIVGEKTAVMKGLSEVCLVRNSLIT
jgi:hypothetical protein